MDVAVARGTQRAEEPRGYLVDPDEYGFDPATPWQPLEPGTDHVDVIACYWQHLAICVLRQKYPVGLRDEILKVVGGRNAEHLDRQLSGAYRIRLNAILEWAIAFEDITLVPQADSMDGLYPPGSR